MDELEGETDTDEDLTAGRADEEVNTAHVAYERRLEAESEDVVKTARATADALQREAMEAARATMDSAQSLTTKTCKVREENVWYVACCVFVCGLAASLRYELTPSAFFTPSRLLLNVPRPPSLSPFSSAMPTLGWRCAL